MPTESAIELMAERKNKITGETLKDIHEKDEEYLKKSHENACEIAKQEGWKEVLCVSLNNEIKKIKTVEEIRREVISIVEVEIKNS